MNKKAIFTRFVLLFFFSAPSSLMGQVEVIAALNHSHQWNMNDWIILGSDPYRHGFVDTLILSIRKLTFANTYKFIEPDSLLMIGDDEIPISLREDSEYVFYPDSISIRSYTRHNETLKTDRIIFRSDKRISNAFYNHRWYEVSYDENQMVDQLEAIRGVPVSMFKTTSLDTSIFKFQMSKDVKSKSTYEYLVYKDSLGCYRYSLRFKDPKLSNFETPIYVICKNKFVNIRQRGPGGFEREFFYDSNNYVSTEKQIHSGLMDKIKEFEYIYDNLNHTITTVPKEYGSIHFLDKRGNLIGKYKYDGFGRIEKAIVYLISYQVGFITHNAFDINWGEVAENIQKID